MRGQAIASGRGHAGAPPVWASRSLRRALFWAGLAVLVGVLYANTLNGPFVFDDVTNIQRNVHIRLTTLSVDGLFRAAFRSRQTNRPVANVSFALNYYVHQYQVRGYHVVNILIHLTTGLLLALFVYTTLTVPALRSSYATPGWIAGGTALLWLVHPLHTESVAYITQRMNSMAAMFYMASLVLYVRARLTAHRRTQWVLGAGSVLTGLLALGTKEIAATLPVVLGLYEWYFFQGLSLHWLKRRGCYIAGGLAVCGLVLAWVYQHGEPLARLLAMYAARDFTLRERVLTEWRVVFLYLRLLLFPHPSQLTLEHDFVLSRSLLDPPTTLLALVALVGLVGLACYLAPKDRLLSFCLVWFLLHLVIESSVIGLELIFEYRTYLPSMLLSVLVVTLVSRHVPLAWLRVAMLGLVVLVFSVWTYDRNRVWASEETLWRDCVAKAPHKARPHNNLGVLLAQQGKLAEATAHLTTVLRLQPTFVTAHNNLGLLLAQQGKLAEATAHYAEALRLRPDYEAAHNNLGNALAQQGKLAEAITHYAKALQIQPAYAEAHYNLGLLFAQQGQRAEAIAALEAALRYRPDWPQAANILARLLATQEPPIAP